jgi:hypothetical protein
MRWLIRTCLPSLLCLLPSFLLTQTAPNISPISPPESLLPIGTTTFVGGQTASHPVLAGADHRYTATPWVAGLHPPESVERQTIVSAFRKLPLRFEANFGEAGSRTDFLARGPGYSLILKRNGVVLRPDHTRSQPEPHSANNRLPLLHSGGNATGEQPLRLEVVGANPHAAVTGVDELETKTNYFIGNDPERWRSNVPSYAKVRYRQIYPHIDLVFYGNEDQIENDFLLSPGADVSSIRLRIQGADNLRLNTNGDLIVTLRDGTFSLKKPVVYQTVAGIRRLVESQYVVHGRHDVQFAVAGYDMTRELVIDPVLSYSTYLGGISYDFAAGIAVDSSGNLYVTGNTTSPDFPIVTGGYDTAYPGQYPNLVFVSKFSPDGKTLIYSTFLGGSSGFSSPAGIRVDANGNVYVVGVTSEPAFPLVNAFQTSCILCPTTDDLFVSKLNASGSKLLYSTYLGGTYDESPADIAIDSTGSAYVTGITQSPDFPVSPGALDPTCGTDGLCNPPFQHGVVAKIDTTKSGAASFVYSTFLGGSSEDVPSGIAIDASGSAYIAGYTQSSDFPTTAGSFQPTWSATYGEAGFITKINGSGTAILYSTYLGAPGGSWISGIAVDQQGSAYVTGLTFSTTFPVTSGAFQTVATISYNGFVSKLNPAGTALVYSSYLGGSIESIAAFPDVARAQGDAIVVDSSGSAYISGQTNETNFPLAVPVQANYGGGGSDVFVSKMDPTGSKLLFSTYLGGNDYDGGAAYEYASLVRIALDSQGSVYVAGETYSANFPTTAGAYKTSLNGPVGTADAFISKISGLPSVPASQVGTISVTTNLSAATFTITGPATYSGSGTSKTISNAPIGTYTITFGPVSGYTTPAAQMKAVVAGGTTTFSAAYTSSLLLKLQVSSPNLLFTQATNSQAQSQKVTVSTTNGATIPISIAVATGQSGNWLSVAPSSGTTPITLTVSIINGLIPLPPASYVGNISITSSQATNSPMNVTVGLDITGSLGRSWRKLSGPWPTTCDGSFGAIAVNLQNPSIVYIGSSQELNTCGLFKSTNAGGTWTSINKGFPQLGIVTRSYPAISRLAVSSSNPSVLYAGTLYDTGVLGKMGGVVSSIDGGLTWKLAPGISSPVLDLSVNPTKQNEVTVGLSQVGILRTTDGGQHWSTIRAGTLVSGATDNYYAVRYAQATPGLVYGSGFTAYDTQLPLCDFATQDCIDVTGNLPFPPYKVSTTTSGTTFTYLSYPRTILVVGVPLITDLAVHPTNSNILYVSTIAYPTFLTAVGISMPNLGVFESQDGGVTWQAVNGPSYADLSQFPIYRLVLDPSAPATLYAVSGFDGVYMTTTGGQHWQQMPMSGLPTGTWFNNIALGNNGVVYALTSKGIYVY